jgi:hypothetical protein
MLHTPGDKSLGTVVGRVSDDVVGVPGRREKIEADLAVAAIIEIGTEDRAAGFL